MGVADKPTIKALVQTIHEAAKERKIKVPSDTAVAMGLIAPHVASGVRDGKLDADAVIATLRAQYGTEVHTDRSHSFLRF